MNMRLPLLAITLMMSACASVGPSDNTRVDGRNDGLADLEVRVTAEIPQGDVRLNLFADGAAYAGGQPVAQGSQSAKSGLAVFSFTDLEPGTYAIKAYHDMNSNGRLDMNVMGIPSEPFAFSNNAPAKFGPAPFEDAQFTVDAGGNVHTMSIR